MKAAEVVEVRSGAGISYFLPSRGLLGFPADHCGIGGSDERLLRCSTLPLTKNTCQVTCSTTALWTSSKDYYSTQILQTLTVKIIVNTSFCLTGFLHIVLFCTNCSLHLKQSLLGKVCLFVSSERHHRIGLLEQLYCRAPRALLLPG